MSQAATGTSNDLNAYQNYFSFTSMNEGEKRKILIQPCTHCQKAHLACDGGRPCQGCIKRDLGTTCSDVLRKKTKLNTEEALFSPTTSIPFTPADQPIDSNFMDTSQLFNFSLTDFGFGSETTGLEYGILGNMSVETDNKSFGLATLFPFNNHPSPTSSPLPQQQLVGQGGHKLPEFSPPLQLIKRDSTSTSSTTTTTTSTTSSSSKSSLLNSTGRRKGNNGNTPEAVYNSVKKPFNYAEGFHYLIQYVTDRMARQDLMRISKALSLFRPSFLSLIMNLTEEDLVFMERCIQRTLLEYEKLISFSGTPTVVWRRTGEVCLVGKEFSLLTQWTRDMLLNKKTYIYELMENQSAVEYWEKFSTHAFDNTDKACSYSCILRTPQQKPVPCTFCFTIKRDIFDLPSVIVGNVSFFLFLWH
ncbi:hypothetical protein INT47_006575 [Mucor saturninus]|uniref:Zn(2)-C6 fungal-type domain-containing protein n=1 Tax=Mucor saturninus TaxID=64648 RepID=A0A8H7R0P5_9FUNG|nr:hypothetical protein INT47_006575 [Mucor saturninus]